MLTVIIIRCKIYFVFFIFVVYANHENIFTTKISRSTVSQLLTSKQCTPNVQNSDCLTPLLIAIKHNNPEAAIALLQHQDCDPTLCDPCGNTPLHLACISGETKPEVVEVAKQLLMLTHHV